MKAYREMTADQRNGELARVLRELRSAPGEISTMAELLEKDKRWGSLLDEAVVIVLEQMMIVKKECKLEGSPLEWLESIVNFGHSREAKIFVERFRQTVRITKAYKALAKDDPQRPRFQKELKIRGIA